jgi:hypothetical protein
MKLEAARMPITDAGDFDASPIEFHELEDRYGYENARAILRALEQFEGVAESQVENLSFEERLKNVLHLMQENIRYQTRH